MITIREIPYNVDFYWKGDRWRQFVRAKVLPSMPKPRIVTCYKLYEQTGYVDMPLGRKVKPVIKLKLTKGNS